MNKPLPIRTTQAQEVLLAQARQSPPLTLTEAGSVAENNLRLILKRDVRNHGLKLADILGIYPCL